jgi:hypothetical protein
MGNRVETMSIAGLILGIINIALVVAILLLIGALAMWLLSLASMAVPANVQKAFLIIVGLIALYMIAALLLGGPTWRIIGPSVPIT